ncbi:GNAT family N-acetyltransferase [Frondihabitans australicus]|uniref:Acetyltransferase (GNAT) family protein n=1 Tax=Frondihabitans australicus TaxID=386892 RepID=A0A495IFS6_9MICO|nr:GNAT family N-acetyltransferase [Frondihabitans australicus]RKR74500.1 acetyltransferase (GNAT) family protein [Frondihabitans australicus]
MLQFRETPVDDPEAHALLEAYFAERVATFPDPAGYTTRYPDPAAFVPPEGVFLLIDLETGGAQEQPEPVRGVACGGIRRLPPLADGRVRYEVKHLYVAPGGRGRGLGRILLAELERRAADLGADLIVLDTNDSLRAAGGLYRSSGYRTTEPYNDNPNATTWYAKDVVR